LSISFIIFIFNHEKINTLFYFIYLPGVEPCSPVLFARCRYRSNEKNIFTVTGNEKDCGFLLQVKDSLANEKGSLAFKFSADKIKKTEQYTGSFTDPNQKTVPVNLNLVSMVWGTPTQHYGELFGTTEEVETFAEKVRIAFIQNDKNWLAAHCKYPLAVYKGSSKPIMIKDKAAFLTGFPKYCTAAYRKKFTAIQSYNMMCNHIGVIMGKGEVKINHTSSSSSANYTYCISSIEVF
jgi:hypothetical protein